MALLLYELTADALATAFFVLGPEKGYSLCRKLDGVECLIVDKEGKTIISPESKERVSFYLVNKGKEGLLSSGCEFRKKPSELVLPPNSYNPDQGFSFVIRIKTCPKTQ